MFEPHDGWRPKSTSMRLLQLGLEPSRAHPRAYMRTPALYVDVRAHIFPYADVPMPLHNTAQHNTPHNPTFHILAKVLIFVLT